MLNNLNGKLNKCQYLRRTISTILYTVYLLLAQLVLTWAHVHKYL